MSSIKDNHHRGSVGEFLKERILPNADLSFVSAFFTIFAYEKLRMELQGIRSLRFLFGDPSFVSTLDPTKAEAKAIVIENAHLVLSNPLQQKAIAKDCAEWIEELAQIRSITKKGFLHGKLYHIDNNGIQEALIGSSNFTTRGLGYSSKPNIELNLEVMDKRDTSELKEWFEEIWNDRELVQDVKDAVLSYLAKLYVDNSPEFIYYKTLFHIFEKFLQDEEAAKVLQDDVKLFDTGIWQALFEFQKDGVKAAINKLQKYNGCIIADSVGLGKTYEALAVIKYFELRNRDSILVLCPKKLRENWTIYRINDQLNPFYQDRFRYDVLSHTDLSREHGKSGDMNLETVNWNNYDLVVIDESHNFRNDTKGQRNEDGEIIRRSRYERLMEEVIKTGVKTKVLMLSATPVNTTLKDLRNQIYFATEGNDDAFKDAMGIASLRELIASAQRRFTNWADPKKNPRRDIRQLMEDLPAAFFKLLDGLSIARSRKHVERYYANELERIGTFPTRLKPISKSTGIDLHDRFMSYDKLNDEIDQYELSLFSPSEFVKPEYVAEYEEKAKSRGVAEFTQAQREDYLIGMMKVNFLKRLESSVNSFAITMNRTIEKIENLEERIRRFRQFHSENPELDWDELKVEDIDDEEMREALEVGKKLKYKLAHLDLDAWSKALKHDKDQLKVLLSSAEAVTPDRDAKLAELKRIIADKVKNPTVTRRGNPNRKILLFTAFADTATYLYDQLADWALSELGIHAAMVTGGNSANQTTFKPKGFRQQTDFNQILTNFSPISKGRERIPTMLQDEEIDLLIATDCISEGQNLQDCDYLVNYDIHWNPVRIIQRFGRIDRIGSVNKEVQLVNFWVTEDLNKYIKLKHRVEARMALVDVAATSEDNVLSNEELSELISEDMRYRDQQLLRLKDEVLDLERFNENVSLSEFTLDDYRIELSKFIEANREKLEQAPFGMYAVVPPSTEFQQIKPGVIFCLKQNGETRASEKVNPIQPYYLTYVRNDGEIRYTFAQTKQVLDVFQHLCIGKTEAYRELCQWFDEKTNQGWETERFEVLLKKTVNSITEGFRLRSAKNLGSGRDAVLVPKSQQPHDTADFELVTWLVIANPASN